FGLTNDVRYALAALPSHLVPLAHYWWNSEPRRFAAISRAYSALIACAIPEHDGLIHESGADNLVRRDGYLLLHRRADELEKAIADAKRLKQQFGVPYRLLDAAAVRSSELSIVGPVVGAIHWTGPWSVADPGTLVKAYAELFARSGGSIATGDATS